MVKSRLYIAGAQEGGFDLWPARVWDEKGDLNADEWTGVLRFIAVHESIARINVAKPSSAAAWVVVDSSCVAELGEWSGEVGVFVDESLMESASRRSHRTGEGGESR